MTMLATFNFGLLGLKAGLLFMEVLLLATSIFLMLLILVQRGKGGGLTGALGGMGGQSAFGSKAGDAFTKITVITAMIWITLCMLTIAAFNPPPSAATAVPDKLEAVDDAIVEDVLATEPETGSMGNSSGETTEESEDKGFQLDLDGPDDVSDDSSTSAGSGDDSDSGSAPDGDTSETESGAGGN